MELLLLASALASLHTMGPRHAPPPRRTPPLPSPPTISPLPSPRFFTSLRDHFSADNTTWNQAYFVNATFYKPGGPVFLCVGGEGPPLDGSVLSSSPHCNNAVEWLPDTGAILFAVEHRYYGCHNASACPYTLSDASPLQWLSSRQALADLAAFHAHATREYKLGNARWITFGGSYPGMLASWARVKYPSLFFASAASSAPVVAKLDMRVGRLRPALLGRGGMGGEREEACSPVLWCFLFLECALSPPSANFASVGHLISPLLLCTPRSILSSLAPVSPLTPSLICLM